MQVLPGWPANSPDLNPIEMLWGIIGSRLAGFQAANEELLAEVIRIWRELDQSTIDGLCQDFARRLRLVIDCGGASISQLLSSHIRVARPQDIIETQLETFSPEEDERIIGMGDSSQTRKWVTLHSEMPAHSKQSLKHRYLTLMMERDNIFWAGYREQFAEENPEVVEVFAPGGDPRQVEAEREANSSGSEADSSSDVDEPPSPPLQRRPTTAASPKRESVCKTPAFGCFAREKRAELPPGLSPVEQGKELGRRWNALSDEEKERYTLALHHEKKLAEKKRGRGRPKKA
jgi:hypothetical protein